MRGVKDGGREAEWGKGTGEDIPGVALTPSHSYLLLPSSTITTAAPRPTTPPPPPHPHPHLPPTDPFIYFTFSTFNRTAAARRVANQPDDDSGGGGGGGGGFKWKVAGSVKHGLILCG